MIERSWSWTDLINSRQIDGIYRIKTSLIKQMVDEQLRIANVIWLRVHRRE